MTITIEEFYNSYFGTDMHSALLALTGERTGFNPTISIKGSTMEGSFYRLSLRDQQRLRTRQDSLGRNQGQPVLKYVAGDGI
jgi:hypothetical protein